MGQPVVNGVSPDGIGRVVSISETWPNGTQKETVGLLRHYIRTDRKLAFYFKGQDTLVIDLNNENPVHLVFVVHIPSISDMRFA